MQSSTDANGHSTQYGYDDADRRTSVTDALNHATAFVYDNAGNQLSVTDANNHATQYVYDANNRRTKVIYPDTNFETTGYDALGRVTSRTDAKGLTTQYGYDALGRLTSVTDALQQVTSYGYDEVGNRITQTDANNHTTKYAYDQRGRRIGRTLPMGQAESYAYDGNGNLSSRTDFNGHVTGYTYDNLNRLLSKSADAFFVTNHFGAAAVGYTYNAQGLRATMSDASGTTTYTYDNRNRLITKATPEGTLAYTYDAAGDVKTIQSSNANGVSMSYAYDALNRLSTVTDESGATSYSYDNVGNLSGFAYPNGVAHAYSYDTRNRLTNLAVNGTVAGAPGPIASYAYTLDASGHRTGVTELSGRNVAYSYDNLYRLTSETIASDPNAVNGTVSYGYDPVGNRLQKTSTLAGMPGTTSSFNANDQLASDTYDNNGNTTASSGKGYSYDFENHLVQQAGLTIVYDGDGNRVAKSTANGTIQYLVDDLNPTGYAQVMDEVQSNTAVRTYTWGLELISEHQSISSTPTSSYYVFDGHGSVRALTNASGAVTDTYDYDAFGNLIHSATTLSSPTPNEFLFAGEQFDPDLALYYNRARYLNTSTGRFWNMDSHEGEDESPLSLHKYSYAANDPADRLDRSGNDFDIGSLAIAIAIDVVIELIPTPTAQEYLPGGNAEPRVATAQSERGEKFLKCHEGDAKCAPLLTVDDHDGSNSCTIGWGHKISDKPCTDADRAAFPSYSVAAAEQQLFLDIQQIALTPIRRYVHVGLAQRELDALIDFTFNVGGGSKTNPNHPGLAGSQLLMALNARNYKQAGSGFLGFLKGGTGIVRRRNDEKNLWDTGRYVSYDHIIP